MEIETNTCDDNNQDKYDIFNSIGEISYKNTEQSDKNLEESNIKWEYWINPKMIDIFEDFMIVNDKFSYFLHFDLNELDGMSKV